MGSTSSPATGGIQTRPDGATIVCRVTPGSPRDEVAGWRAGRLHLRVRAAALEGRANDAVVDLLATTLDVRRSSVRLLQGHRSREKTVLILGMDADTLRRRLPPQEGGGRAG
ncbi:MAG: DUF167 domain-containing protein [Armatimonadetes bacterium]|nr:DUF167 domain-containing protein [Armatimonadota bacterium]